jgi:hypothetical protein
LVSDVAVADPDWRDVLTHGPAVWATVRGRAGTQTAREAARFGRFGWINLVGLLAGSGGRGGRGDLVSLVDGTPADDLRFAVAGGLRRQLRDRLDPDRLRDALAGDASAGRELGRALASPLPTSTQLVTKGRVNCSAHVVSTGCVGLARNPAAICTAHGDLP